MKSFSSFKPVLSGTPQEIKAHTFAMWLRANAYSIKKPFDPNTWRTARPWLSFKDIKYQNKLFKERSLGVLLVGNVRLTDSDVFKAIEYEALATKKISDTEIRRMVLQFYDFSRTDTVERREVLDRINEEFAYLDRGYVSERDTTWKAALKAFTERTKCTLKPKIHESKVADIIMQAFQTGDSVVPQKDILREIAPILAKHNQTLDEDSPILRRAVAITGQLLKPNNHQAAIEHVIQKYYVRHPLANEPLERLQHVVNMSVQIPPHFDVWSSVDLHIAPKHDWKDEEGIYEEAIDETFHSPPSVNDLQEPFMRYVLPYRYVRRKQNIPWKTIIKKCKRNRGTDEKSIQNINKMIETLGFKPYHTSHRVFDIIRVQGLTLGSST